MSAKKFDFTTHLHTPDGFRSAGAVFFGVGVVLLAASIFVGPMNSGMFHYYSGLIKLVLVIGGGSSFVAGAVFMVGAELWKALHDLKPSPEPELDRETKKPVDYHLALFRIGDVQVWANEDGRVWAAGLFFDTPAQARAWATGEVRV